MASFVAAGVPAQIVRVSNTTLFHVAAQYLGDAMLWTRLALINGMTDPWIGTLIELKIPKFSSDWLDDGILGQWIDAATFISAPIETVAPSAPVVPATITMAQINALIPYLPTTLPDTPGVLWSNGGLVCIS